MAAYGENLMATHLDPGIAGDGGSSRDNDPSCRNDRTLRAWQAGQRGVAEANQWLNPLKTPPSSNPMDTGWRSGAQESGYFFAGFWSWAALIRAVAVRGGCCVIVTTGPSVSEPRSGIP